MSQVNPSFDALPERRSSCIARYQRIKNHLDISVHTISIIPALTICGQYQEPKNDDNVCGEVERIDSELELLTLGINCTDELLPAAVIFEVASRDGELLPVSHMRWCSTTIGSTSTWTSLIRPARDRHEQNVEVSFSETPPPANQSKSPRCRMVARTLQPLEPGDELLAWYSDELARQCGVPILTPTNITADRWYICSACCRRFRYPNPLKAHILFHCNPALTSFPPPPFSIGLCNSFPFKSVWSYTMFSNGQNWCQTSPFTFETFEKATGEHIGIPDPVREQNCGYSRGVSMKIYEEEINRYVTTNRPRPSIRSEVALINTDVPTRHNPIKIQNNHCNNVRSYINREQSDSNKDFDKVNGFLNPTTEIIIKNSKTIFMNNTEFSMPLLNTCSQNDHTNLVNDGREFTGNELPLSSAPCKRKIRKIDRIVKELKREHKELKQEQSPSLAANKTRSRHPCVFCGKLYSRRYGLTIHLRTHSGYKPLNCRVCARPFGDPSNLNKHIRLHAIGETPYNCTHCGKVLVRRRDLERHIRSRHPNQLSGLSTVQHIFSSKSLCEARIGS